MNDYMGNEKIKTKVLILGSESYIGEKFKSYLEQWPEAFEVATVDTINDSWREHDFSTYDVVYDVAGIAHVKETKKNHNLYYQVNRDLALEAAKKAKEAGVKLFVYLSTMLVYGMSAGRIHTETPVNPINAYAKSKLQAEQGLVALCDDAFHVAVVRPPMVYGKNCKGNYQLLRKFALKIGIFPAYDNERSLIFIDNLSSAIRGIIESGKSGIYFPQNMNYVNIREMVECIGKYHHKKIHEISFLNPIIKWLCKRSLLFQKVFGDLTYDQKMNVPESWIEKKNNEDTFRMTESHTTSR